MMCPNWEAQQLCTVQASVSATTDGPSSRRVGSDLTPELPNAVKLKKWTLDRRVQTPDRVPFVLICIGDYRQKTEMLLWISTGPRCWSMQRCRSMICLVFERLRGRCTQLRSAMSTCARYRSRTGTLRAATRFIEPFQDHCLSSIPTGPCMYFVQSPNRHAEIISVASSAMLRVCLLPAHPYDETSIYAVRLLHGNCPPHV